MPNEVGLDHLRRALQAGTVVPVVGAGVSAAVAGLPGWAGLIRKGIDFAESSGSCTPAEAAAVRGDLDAGQLLPAAQGVKRLLRAPGGQYAAWLDQTFEDPTFSAEELSSALADLFCPLVATTNYDTLLEHFLLGRFESTTWCDPKGLLKALEKGQRVLHLHGIYSDPKSVVLGIDNYEDLVRDPAYRAVLQTLWLQRTLLFVGCSFAGLEDPDFSRMLDWFAATFPGASQRHYALMLEGTYTDAERQRWLHDLRIQVVPYGPSHAALAPRLRELNPNADRAYARRILLSKLLLEGAKPADVAEFVSLLQGAGSRMPLAQLQTTAAALFSQMQDQSGRMRENLSTMQLLARSMVDPEKIREEISKWDSSTKYEGSFRETVQQAAAALFLIDERLLDALHQRDVNVHGNVLSGFCRSLFTSLESGRGEWDVPPYWIENMKRILTSLEAVLQASPEAVFPDPRPGTTTAETLDGSLAVFRRDRIELRRIADPGEVLAALPLGGPVYAGEFAMLEGNRVIVAYEPGALHAWNPAIPTPVAVFPVGRAHGINSVSHRDAAGVLESIVATTDGPVFKLHDLKPVRTWSPLPPKEFVSHVTLLPDGRIFAVFSVAPRIVELTEDGGYADRFTVQDFQRQLADVPLLGAHFRRRKQEDREYFGELESEEDTESDMKTRLQHAELGSCRVGGKALLTFHLQLSFHVQDSLVLLLDPDSNPLRIVGHYLIEDQFLAGFDLWERKTGNLVLAGALLQTESEPTYDLLVWARAAPTNRGLIFVSDGSALRTSDDLVKVAFAAEDSCFAADDSGGLFQISMATRESREIAREERSRIFALRCCLPSTSPLVRLSKGA